FQFSTSAGNGNCVRLTPTNGTQDIEGLPTAEVEQLGCCRDDISISGTFFLMGDPLGTARTLSPTFPPNGVAQPAADCWGEDFVLTVRAFIPVNWVPDPLFKCGINTTAVDQIYS